MDCSCHPPTLYFNPRSPHGERHPFDMVEQIEKGISIHAPRTGSDSRPMPRALMSSYFNPRSPHGERPGRGSGAHCSWHFNPRSPHGERQKRPRVRFSPCQFQSTLPARGATSRFPRQEGGRTIFQSTLPARGATEPPPEPPEPPAISIHAPRTGSDIRSPRPSARRAAFQSTLPARGATVVIAGVLAQVVFQSTLPARGATGAVLQRNLSRLISIHAPRTGSDNAAFAPAQA